ncbi:MAG TPA: polysaccharide deacetylase family protein [Rhizomicrobium sp.]|jgi:peptidoglycan/xylan/chitin deacetylase (PgdA/CDA1 family)|nr:polysaccharide deacetylase family protein [Rhizomicrobium sp.]
MSISGRLFRQAGRWIPPALTRPFGGPAAVYFHGVEDTITDAHVQNNHHDADTFRAIAKSLRADFDVLPLSELDAVLADPRKYTRALFVMSDDGYANVARVAAPILAEFGLAWTLFVSTQHIDTGQRNPMFVARLFFAFAPPGRYEISRLGTVVLGDPQSRDVQESAAIAALKGMDGAAARQAIKAMAAVLSDVSLNHIADGFSSDKFLNWDDVRALKKSGVEIGAHAHWHWPMNQNQSPQSLLEQARLPKARIEAEVGACRFFAYPFGNVDDVGREAWRAVKDAGYDAAFTTLSGTLDASTNRFLLPRYGLGLSERHAASLIPLLRAGNRRLVRWQKAMAA